MRPMAYTSNAEATPAFTLPKPAPDPTLATAPPARMDLHEKSRASAAAAKAKRDYPGPIGECLSRELEAYSQWGYRLDQTGLMPRLVAHIMTTEQR